MPPKRHRGGRRGGHRGGHKGHEAPFCPKKYLNGLSPGFNEENALHLWDAHDVISLEHYLEPANDPKSASHPSSSRTWINPSRTTRRSVHAPRRIRRT